MKRPLLITDCDEVLLHMVQHFKEWLADERDIEFTIGTPDFMKAMKKPNGDYVSQDEMWALLNSFFDTEMHRQTLVPHAIESLGKIGEYAEIVVLTNLGDVHREGRIDQLASHGINHHVVCNQGGKGDRVAELLKQYQPPSAVFVDDLAFHHHSVSKCGHDIWRLHMIAEPKVAEHTPPAEDAHARIDDWPTATSWIEDKLTGG